MPRDYRSASHRRAAGLRLSRPRRHQWYARLVVGTVLVGVAAALFWMRGVLLPFVIAAVIAYVLAPAVERFQKLGIPRWLGVICAYVTFLGSVFLFFYYLVPKLEYESKRLIEKIQVVMRESPQYYRELERSVESLLGGTEADVEALPAAPPGLRWGFGPRVEPVEDTDIGADVPFLRQARFAAEEKGAAAVALPNGATPPVEAELEERRSSLVVTRIRDGEWGIRVNESSLEIEQLGEGRFNFTARPGRQNASTVANIRDQILDSVRGGLEEIGGRVIGSIVGMVQGIVQGVMGAVIGIIITFMVAAFLLIDLHHIRATARARIPERYRSHYDELLSRLDDGVSGVVRGQLFICLVNGVLSAAGFFVLIPEYAVVMAILSSVMSLIPIFGTIISTVPAVLIGLTVSFGTALGVLGWILGIHFIEANILNPKIVGAQAKIHPALVMLVIIAGETMYGIKGALLAVPFFSVVQTLVVFAYTRAETVLMRNER